MVFDRRGAMGFFQKQSNVPLEQHIGGFCRRHMVRALFGAQLGAHYDLDDAYIFVRCLAGILFGGMGGPGVAHAIFPGTTRAANPNTCSKTLYTASSSTNYCCSAELCS